MSRKMGSKTTFLKLPMSSFAGGGVHNGGAPEERPLVPDY